MGHAASPPLSDAALVIAAHGATRCGIEEEPAFRHAEALRGRSLFARVEAGFWKREPELQAVIDRCAEPHVFIVPFFISGGYFAGSVIPSALGFDLKKSVSGCRRLCKGGQCFYYGRAIGNHPSMARIILARAGEAMDLKTAFNSYSSKQREDGGPQLQLPFGHPAGDASENTIEGANSPDSCSLFSSVNTALVIAGHGTEKHAASKEAILEQAQRIRDLRIFAEVQPAFLEESPRIDQVPGLVDAPDMVVVPFFIGEGGHVMEDIPIMLGASANEVQNRLRAGLPAWRNPSELHGKRIWYAEAVGGEPMLAEVILARALECQLFQP